MAKKIVGNYPDTDAVVELMDTLEATGYPVGSITVIADADLVDLDEMDAAIEEGFDFLNDVSDELLRESIEGFFAGEAAGTYDDEIAAYCDGIRDGDILVLVEDTLVPEDSEAYAILYGMDDTQEGEKPFKRAASTAKSKAKAAPTAKAASNTKAAPKAKTTPKAKAAPKDKDKA